METSVRDIVKQEIQKVNNQWHISSLVFKQANSLYINGQSQLLTQSKDLYDFLVDDEYDDYAVKISINGQVEYHCDCKAKGLCHHKIACLFQLEEELSKYEDEVTHEGKAYTREGMIHRVMEERKLKAMNAKYRFEFADNIYGEHLLINEKAVKYKITLRNIENEVGYCSCPDYQTNKLGTCKHLMFVFDYIKNRSKKKIDKSQPYPFVEIFLDPMNDYKISWYYPHKLSPEIESIITEYFEHKKHIEHKDATAFLGFLGRAEEYKKIIIRPEVYEKVERAFNKKAITDVGSNVDFDEIINEKTDKVQLFPYQEEGIRFATFREGAIIADEMGLGKTVQAIFAAILKKEMFEFNRTLVICPASLKDQWRREIEKFTNETCEIVEGFPEYRAERYQKSNAFFHIINYETALRDATELTKYPPDFIILDEAQRVKNYDTQTSHAIKRIPKKHALVITGTPIENRLIDLYSIVNFVDKNFLTPLWEFSYQHCYFDHRAKNRITGYYNLQNLKERLSEILIRREKRDVFKQLPTVREMDIPVEMHPVQSDYHASFSRGVASILAKKIKTAFDMQRLMNLLTNMRMVCDSSYLIDHETNHSPKLEELEYILMEKMELKTTERKIIIFSEWKRMNNIIGGMLRKHNVGFVELNGSVPVKKRGNLIAEFEDNPRCKVFISTEAGGSGLNLQVADTVINFELPWNPAKKNQRIGRIDRLGQLKNKLTVINFITKNSIETKIAGGLLLKQNLFDNVLSPKFNAEEIDFSSGGKSQFLSQIEEMVNEVPEYSEIDEKQETIQEEKEEIAVSEVDNDKKEKIDEIKSEKEITETKEPVKQAEPESEKEETRQIVDEEPLKAAAKQQAEPHEEFVEVEKIPQKEKSEVRKKETDKEQTQKETVSKPAAEEKAEQLEQVMNQGLGFISGLFKMATGQDLVTQDKGISVNRETGEVTMKFKLPV